MKNKMNVIGTINCAGVYVLKDMATGEIKYIGSSVECNDALSRHLHYLKRGQYKDTNKALLQEIYDRETLVFEVLHRSEESEVVKNMSAIDKENLQIALSTLENFYIDLYKDTIVNSQMSVKKHSSNKNSLSTFLRRRSNTGKLNPNNKYSETVISEILWLKLNGYNTNEISEFYKDVSKTYIPSIGVSKWIFLEPVKPEFIVDAG